MAVGINDIHSCLGENNRAAKVSKGAQADEGMGDGLVFRKYCVHRN